MRPIVDNTPTRLLVVATALAAAVAGSSFLTAGEEDAPFPTTSQFREGTADLGPGISLGTALEITSALVRVGSLQYVDAYEIPREFLGDSTPTRVNHRWQGTVQAVFWRHPAWVGQVAVGDEVLVSSMDVDPNAHLAAPGRDVPGPLVVAFGVREFTPPGLEDYHLATIVLRPDGTPVWPPSFAGSLFDLATEFGSLQPEVMATVLDLAASGGLSDKLAQDTVAAWYELPPQMRTLDEELTPKKILDEWTLPVSARLIVPEDVALLAAADPARTSAPWILAIVHPDLGTVYAAEAAVGAHDFVGLFPPGQLRVVMKREGSTSSWDIGRIDSPVARSGETLRRLEDTLIVRLEWSRAPEPASLWDQRAPLVASRL